MTQRNLSVVHPLYDRLSMALFRDLEELIDNFGWEAAATEVAEALHSVAELHRQQRRALGGTRGPIPRSVREKILDRDGRACLSCGATEDLAIDHVIPRSQGGPNDPSNFQVLCRSCNSAKGAR